MGWDDADKKAKDTGGMFIKLQNDEDSFKGVLMGPPTCEDTFYDKVTGKTRTFTEEDEKAGNKPTPKFKFNVFAIEVNDEKLEKPNMRIFTCNATTYRFISKQRQKRGGDLGWYPVYIVRNGVAKDTNTTYNVSVSDTEISDALKKAAKAMKLHNLEGADDDSEGESNNFGSYEASKKEDGPISKDQMAQLAGSYKPGQPLADHLQGFLTKFGIQKFKELKASQFDDAMSYTKELLKGGEESSEEESEDDPFA